MSESSARLARLLSEGESARRAGLLAAAREGFMAAADVAEAEGDQSALVEAALGAGGLWVQEQRELVARAQVQDLWARAWARVPSGSLAQARLAVRLAAEAVYEGARVGPVVEAVEAVAAFGEDGATAEALSLLHHVRLGPRHAESRLEVAEEIVRLGARAGDGVLALMGLCWRTVDLFLLGSPRAAQSLVELRRRANAESCDAVGFIADVLGAMVIARAGRLDDAEVAATLAADRGNRVGDPDAGAYFGAILATVRWWQGRASDVVGLVREISTTPELGFNDHVFVAADAALSAASGDLDAAEHALARLTNIGLGRLNDSSTVLTTYALVAEATYLLGDTAAAAEARVLLSPYAHLPVMPSLASACLGSAERGVGLAAATVGHLDAAAHHLDAAVRADRLVGNRPMEVLTEHTLAGVLSARAAAGDQARAEQLTRRAHERARQMGMVLPSHPAWLSAGPRPSGAPTRARVASLELGPGTWTITVDHRTSLVPDRVGFAYLSQLIQAPNREVDVAVLVGGNGIAGRADALLDETAIRSYRRRAGELTAALTRTDIDPVDAARLRTERDAISAILRSGTGRYGKSRAFPDSHERARTAVRKALVRALAAITAVEPDFGHHLAMSLTTGATCRYTPGETWKVTVRTPVRLGRD